MKDVSGLLVEISEIVVGVRAIKMMQFTGSP